MSLTIETPRLRIAANGITLDPFKVTIDLPRTIAGGVARRFLRTVVR